MEFLPPFVAHGTLRMSPTEIEGHAADYRRLIEALRDDRVAMDRAREVKRLNTDLTTLLKG
jgi:glutathione-regulated potassium-efflux system ancillary protein KefG